MLGGSTRALLLPLASSRVQAAGGVLEQAGHRMVALGRRMSSRVCGGGRWAAAAGVGSRQETRVCVLGGGGAGGDHDLAQI